MDVYVAIAIATGASSEHASGLLGKPFHALALTCSIWMGSTPLGCAANCTEVAQNRCLVKITDRVVREIIVSIVWQIIIIVVLFLLYRLDYIALHALLAFLKRFFCLIESSLTCIHFMQNGSKALTLCWIKWSLGSHCQ